MPDNQLICIFFLIFRRGRWWGRRRRGRRWLNKLFLFCCHPTSSFRTTYTKYATSSSSLLSKNKKIKKTKNRKQKKDPTAKTTNRRKRKNPNLRKKRIAKCQANPIWLRTSSYKFEKQLKRDGVFSQKTKIILKNTFHSPPPPYP